MRDNEKVRYKNNKFKDSNYECFENGNYKMVRIEPECVTKTRSRKRKVVAERCREKARGRGRHRKWELTVPRIKIRDIPKSVKQKGTGSSKISCVEGVRLIQPIDTDSPEKSIKKKVKRPKLRSKGVKGRGDLCTSQSQQHRVNKGSFQ